MSDDLISRKSLLEEIQSFRCSITGLRAGKGILAHAADEYRKSILQIVEDQPVVFDKEKAIKELKQNRDIAEAEYKVAGEYGDDGNFLLGKVMAYDIAMEIVEKGGLDE